jgi:integrase
VGNVPAGAGALRCREGVPSVARVLRISGHVVLESRADGQVFVAKYMRAEGTPTRKVIGPAWAKPARKEAERGAPAWKRWRAADGPKPDDSYLTPREAQDALDVLLNAERAKLAANGGLARQRPRGRRSLSEAATAYLEHCERVTRVAPSTLGDRRSVVNAHLLPTFGADTPVRRINAARIDGYRDDLLDNDELSRARAVKIMFVLAAILKYAQKRGWIAHNPAADVEPIPTPTVSGDFHLLEPTQVEAIARAAADAWEPVFAGDRVSADGRRVTRIPESSERPLRGAAALTDQRRADAETYAAMIRFAAYTGLRLGELRALRWRDINVQDRILHVELNAPTSGPQGAAARRPKSSLVRSVPLTDMAIAAIEDLSRREHWTGPDDLVFPSPTGGRIDGGKVRDAFYLALDTAGLGHLRWAERPNEANPKGVRRDDALVWHDLRHVFASLAVRVAPITDVQAWLGHGDLRTTQRYLHHVPRHDDAQRLSRAFAIEANPLNGSAAVAVE